MRHLFLPSFVLLILGILLGSSTPPSKFVSRTGHLHVESANRFKTIRADNYQMYCELTPANGDVLFRGLLKSFEFELGALDQAFNSGRVDMSQFSKFRFNGKLTNYASVNFDKPGSYPVTVKGTLYMGGYQRLTDASGTLTVLPNGQLKADANFTIVIEQESVNTINRLMKEKLPSMIAMDMDKLGVSRNIQLDIKATFRPRG